MDRMSKSDKRKLCPGAMNLPVSERGYAAMLAENGTHVVVICLSYLPSGSRDLC